jgi:hypothetical protein
MNKMAKRKRETRATRLQDAVELAEKSKNILEELTSDLDEAVELGMDEEQNTKIVNSIKAALIDIEDATGRVMELHAEMESWTGNMEGTNLENTQRYEDATIARDYLEDAVNTFDNVEILDTADIRDKDASELLEFVEDAISELDSAIDLCNGVEFPGAR